MFKIEVAVRGPDDRCAKLVNAMAHGLKEQMGATPWRLVASLTDSNGKDLGAIERINEGRKL